MSTNIAPPPRSPAQDPRTGEINPRDFARWVNEISKYLNQVVSQVVTANEDVLNASSLISDAQAEIDALQATDVTHIVGPASATDNALARFDGATGKLAQNSTATLSDAGVLDLDGHYRVDGTQVLSNQGAAVADASGGATIDAEARTAINTLLARVRAHGIIAT